MLLAEAEADEGTACTRILGESNAAMGQKRSGLDLSNRVFDESCELLPLFVGNCRAEVLNFDQPLANEDDLGYFVDPAHPGVANELGIKCGNTDWLFRITGRGGLPLNNAFCPI